MGEVLYLETPKKIMDTTSTSLFKDLTPGQVFRWAGGPNGEIQIKLMQKSYYYDTKCARIIKCGYPKEPVIAFGDRSCTWGYY